MRDTDAGGFASAVAFEIELRLQLLVTFNYSMI